MTNYEQYQENQRLREELRKEQEKSKHIVRDFVVAGTLLVLVVVGAVAVQAKATPPSYENKTLAPVTFSVTCYGNVKRQGKIVCVSSEADLLKDATFFKMGNS